MQGQKIERGPRGRYARLICRLCRSRKIKCILPSPDEIACFGVKQTPERSCERCRHFGLDCVVERTTLGRPASRRRKRLLGNSPSALVDSDNKDDENNLSTPSSLVEVQDYLYAEASHDSPDQLNDDKPNSSRAPPSQKEVFQSMIEYSYFFSAVLAQDEAFGSSLTQATSPWSTPLPDLISNDMVASLDSCLVWHRFFLPQTPTLVGMREYLLSDKSAATNTATNLLFALLCLTALETGAADQHARLKKNLQLAVSSYGQEFIFSPPTHRHSVVLCLFLSEYKPTALVTLQRVARKAIKSELYISIACRIAERLEILPAQDNSSLNALKTSSSADFERYLADSIQEMQLICNATFINGFLSKSVHHLRHVLGLMKPYIDAYQNALESGKCSPKAIFHIQWTIATYFLLQALADTKQNWRNPESLFTVTENGETKCLEQIKSSHCLLVDASKYGQRDIVSAVRSLLELRFHMVSATICSSGLLYASALSARHQSGEARGDPEMNSHEALQLVAQVAGSNIEGNTGPISDGENINFSTFLIRFGKYFPERLGAILEMFIECTRLELGGIALKPVFRCFVLEIVMHAKNIVENNILQLRCYNALDSNFDKQLGLFKRCTQQLDSIAASPGSGTDAAFAGGCVFAASSKIITGLLHLMESLQTRTTKKDNDDDVPLGTFDMTANPNDAWGMEHMSSWEALNLQPYVGAFDSFDVSEGLFDWPLNMNLDLGPGFYPTESSL